MIWEVDASWTLFLDRDGVLNERIIGDYVRKPDQFKWLPGVMPALHYLTLLFGTTVVVTNQQGVGKGLMTESELAIIHSKMRQQARFAKAKIDAVYACTGLATNDPPCRKPNTGMAHTAKADHPHIDFSKSIMVGDSGSDIEFGAAVGMGTVYVGTADDVKADLRCDNLWTFAQLLGA